MAGTFTATQVFHAESDTELALQIGDRVSVSTFDESRGWAYGNVGNRAGWFPFNHVTENTENHQVTARQPPPPVTARQPPAPVTARQPQAPVTGRQPSPSVGSRPGTNNRQSSFSQNLSQLEQLFGGAQITNNVKEQLSPTRRKSDITQPQLDYSTENYNRPQYNNNGPSNSNYQYTEPAATPPHSGRGNYYASQQHQQQANARPPSFGGPHGNGGGPNRNGVASNPTLPTTSPPRFTFPNHSRRSSQVRNFTFQFCVEALHPYTKQSENQLTFAAKEKLDIMENPSPDEDWWFARNKSGEIGVVPKNYVKQKQQSTPVLAERLWYKYGISRDETEHQMRSKPIECYVIRDSEAFPGCFTLSVKGPDKVRHIKITTVSDGYEIGDKKFSSLDAVVDFYRNSPIYIADDGAYQLFLSRPLYR